MLIRGENGTGKERVARQIHQCHKSRSNGYFLTLNCAAVSDGSFEAELFGQVSIASTDPIAEKDGLWKLAHNGTLFLDEIASLSLKQQSAIWYAKMFGFDSR